MIDPIAPDTGQCVVRGVDNDVGRVYLVEENPSVCRPPSSDVLDAGERSNASLHEHAVRNDPPSTCSASSTRDERRTSTPSTVCAVSGLRGRDLRSAVHI